MPARHELPDGSEWLYERERYGSRAQAIREADIPALVADTDAETRIDGRQHLMLQNRESNRKPVSLGVPWLP
jgi:hypothetical protein